MQNISINPFICIHQRKRGDHRQWINQGLQLQVLWLCPSFLFFIYDSLNNHNPECLIRKCSISHLMKLFTNHKFVNKKIGLNGPWCLLWETDCFSIEVVCNWLKYFWIVAGSKFSRWTTIFLVAPSLIQT